MSKNAKVVVNDSDESEKIIEKKASAFATFINKIKEQFKINPVTIGGSSVVAAFAAIIGWLESCAFSTFDVNLPVWAYYLVLIASSLVIFAILEVFIIVLGKDSALSKKGKDLLKAVGLGDAVELLQKDKDEKDAKAAEEAKVAEQLKAEEDARAAEEAKVAEQLKAEEDARVEAESQRAIEIEKQRIKQIADQKKAEYQQAVASGSFTGTLLDYLHQNK